MKQKYSWKWNEYENGEVRWSGKERVVFLAVRVCIFYTTDTRPVGGVPVIGLDVYLGSIIGFHTLTCVMCNVSNESIVREVMCKNEGRKRRDIMC